jgi:hypothetical protein
MVELNDIESKARELQAALDETRESAQNTAVIAGVVIVVVVLAAFVLGRRRGKRSKAVVEIYRV